MKQNKKFFWTAFMIYLVLLFIVGCFLIFSSGNKPAEPIVFLIVGCILAFFSMFRYDVGVDYKSYVGFFNEISSGKETYMERGFVYLVRFISYIGGTAQLMFAITSCLFVFFYMKFIVNQSRLPALSIFIFLALPPLYLASFNGLRQLLAVAIFAYSLKYVVEKSFVKFLLLILLGATMHVTILLMLPLYFILRKKMSLFLIGGLIFGIVVISTNLPFIIQLLGISPIYLMTNSNSDSGLSVIAFLLPVVALLALIFRGKFTNLNQIQTNVYINLTLFGAFVALIPLFTEVKTAFVVRMTSYFTFSLLILIPEFVFLLKKPKLHILFLLVVIIICCSYYIFDIIKVGYAVNLLPYQFNFKLF